MSNSKNIAKRILIVEDDEPTASTFKRILENLGEIRVAENSEEAYFQLIDFKPEVVVLDIWLEGEKKYTPQTAGISILQKIRERSRPFNEVPVVIITALTDSETEACCKKLGVAAFLRKPFPNQSLRDVVAGALSPKQNYQQFINVFVSSPMSELRAERITAKQAIQDLGPQYVPQIAEDWVARSESPTVIWQKAVDVCDIFVLLLGKHYGKRLNESGVSATEDEYNRARSAHKPILIFRKDIPLRSLDPDLHAFLARLRDVTTGHIVKKFTDLEQLRSEVQRAVYSLSEVGHSLIYTIPASEESTNNYRQNAFAEMGLPAPIHQFVALVDQIAACFSKDELEDLCLRLGIDTETVVVSTDKLAIIRKIVEYCARRSMIVDLIQMCSELRPKVKWSWTPAT